MIGSARPTQPKPEFYSVEFSLFLHQVIIGFYDYDKYI
jgi:hypothetical protein